MRRVGMSFQRTHMAADRTLMAVIGTALSLISFGFTIRQLFNKLQDAGVLKCVKARVRRVTVVPSAILRDRASGR
jgi:uncharacterized membrane protein YidH (DUF202 family)